MGVSIHLMRRFSVLFLTAVGAAGCGQGASDAVLPSAPSSFSAGPVASSDAGVSTTMAGPGDSYSVDGTTWTFVVYNGPSANSPLDGDFDSVLHQDSAGNVTFLDDDGNTITFTRLGTGATISYKVSLVADAAPCDFEVSGIARLDTRTDTGTANVVIRDSDCSHGVQYVTFSKK